ncbi:MAG: hypothetical protein R6U13_15445, partial [Desulfatiglandaceae bacterium]
SGWCGGWGHVGIALNPSRARIWALNFVLYRPIRGVIARRREKMDGLEQDQCYALGANSYIVKPAGWDELNYMIKSLFPYWTRTVRLPKIGFILSPKNADRELPMRIDHAVQ